SAAASFAVAVQRVGADAGGGVQRAAVAPRGGTADGSAAVRGDEPGGVLRGGDGGVLRAAGGAPRAAAGAVPGAGGVLWVDAVGEGRRRHHHRGAEGTEGRQGCQRVAFAMWLSAASRTVSVSPSRSSTVGAMRTSG